MSELETNLYYPMIEKRQKTEKTETGFFFFFFNKKIKKKNPHLRATP